MSLTYQPGSVPGFGMPVSNPPGATGKDLLRQIAREVGARYGVSVEDITGESRLRPIVHARQEVAWRLYSARHPSGARRFSMPQIGAWLGGRDHTTILHAIRSYEKRTGVRA